MKGPIEITAGGNMSQRSMRYETGKIIEGEEEIHSETTEVKYWSEDERLECRLISTIHTGNNVKSYQNDNGTERQDPANIFEISPLKGEDTLRRIVKEQNIQPNDFPIIRNTKEEADEVPLLSLVKV
jgi:hypothetical protein